MADTSANHPATHMAVLQGWSDAACAQPLDLDGLKCVPEADAQRELDFCFHQLFFLLPNWEASAQQVLSAADQLLAAGAQPDRRTPAWHVCEFELSTHTRPGRLQSQLLQGLLERGFFVPVHYLAWANLADQLRVVLRDGAQVNEDFGEGLTALHCAAWSGAVEAVQVLLEHGAQVDPVYEPTGATPLILAVLGHNSAVLERLLKAGADAEHPGAHGFRPLHHAARVDHLQAFELLEAWGADRSATNDRGEVPQDVAGAKVRAWLEQEHLAGVLPGPVLEAGAARGRF